MQPGERGEVPGSGTPPFPSQVDMDTELLTVTIVKALVELAGFFLLGQGLLYLLAARSRSRTLPTRSCAC